MICDGDQVLEDTSILVYQNADNYSFGVNINNLERHDSVLASF